MNDKKSCCCLKYGLAANLKVVFFIYLLFFCENIVFELEFCF